MIKSFNDTSLTDIMMKKLSFLDYDVYFAGYEKIFKSKSDKYRINFIKRSKSSSLSEGPNSKIHEYLQNLNYEYFLLINACLPFLRVSSINNFINFCLKSKSPKTILTEKKNYIFEHSFKNLNFPPDSKRLNTKTVKPYYELSNSMYFFNKKYLFENKTYWNWKNIKYFKVKNNIEFFDIDTQEEFPHCQKVIKREDLQPIV